MVGETQRGKKKHTRPKPPLLPVRADTIVWTMLTFPKCHSRRRHRFGKKKLTMALYCTATKCHFYMCCSSVIQESDLFPPDA